MLTTILCTFSLLADCPQNVGGDWVPDLWFAGEFDNDEFGSSADYIDDLDGDEIADVIIGAPRSRVSQFGPRLGKAYAYSGAFPNSQLFTWEGELEDSCFGQTVASAGDVNRDGFADILVGAPDCSFPLRAGVVFVYSGRDGTLIYRLQGNVGEAFGNFVKGLGDLNLDGHADFLIGARLADTFGTDLGAWRVFSGKDASLMYEIGGPWPGNGESGDSLGDANSDGYPDFILSDRKDGGSVAVHSGLDGSVIFRLYEPFGSSGHFGWSVANVNDVDGDRINDFIVGGSIQGQWGRAYVYSTATQELLYVFKPEYSNHTIVAGFGSAVGYAGDVNGDGIGDFLVGDQSHDTHYAEGSGAVSVFSGFDGSRILLQYAYRNGGVVTFNLGGCVDGGEDLNGDGFPEILVCAERSTISSAGDGAVVRLSFRPWLTLSPQQISAASGGVVYFLLDFPSPEEKNKEYVLLASSDHAGRSGEDNYFLPLVQSPVLHRMYFNPPANFDIPKGNLNSSAIVQVRLTLAPGEAAAAIGRRFRFSAVTLNPGGDPSLASAGVTLEILP